MVERLVLSRLIRLNGYYFLYWLGKIHPNEKPVKALFHGVLVVVLLELSTTDLWLVFIHENLPHLKCLLCAVDRLVWH